MISSFLFAITIAQVPVVMSGRDSLASPWVQSVQASCGRKVLTVAGYGAANPLDRRPQVLVGRRSFTGPAVRQLLDDLANRRAVYRFTILCDPRGGAELRIEEGEKQRGGGVRYRSGAAFIKGNRLVSYTGLEEADADSFWFR